MENILLLVVLLLLVVQAVMCITVCLLLMRQMNVPVELPKVPNPVKAIKEHKANKEPEAKAEWDRNSIILQNIENYDGTANNQTDVPWR